VIVILTDDQGWGDLSFHGNTNLSTQHLDWLARSGARFDRFFVCPVCAPTRAEFLTGRFHLRTGVTGVSLGRERLNLDEWTIAQDFRAAGYATACFGKWHNGTQYPYHPNARGFDEFYGFCSGHWGDYFSPPLDHNGSPVQGEGYIVDDFTNRALDFIAAHAHERFFLFLPLPTPHTPMQVPEAYWQRFKDRRLNMPGPSEKDEDLSFTRAALAMVENIDENVGRVLSKLDELKLSQDTLLVFFCDNGPNSDRWNGGMRGRKGSTDEGGVRSPLFISWPGRIQPDRWMPQICSVVDLYPTITDLAGITVGHSKPIDGISLAPWLTGQNSSLPERVVVSHWNGQVSVRTQQHRLDSRGRLYDMITDPGQVHDLAAEHPALAQQLHETKATWERQVSFQTISRDQRPYPIGHPEFSYTQLPARDGIPHGSVRRSSAAPNCSYFTDWTSTSDSISWNVQVLKAGCFEVELYYACADSLVGTQVRVSFEDSAIQAPVEHANDPPARGAENDRVPRSSESYVKDFLPVRLGVIELSEGAGTLRLTLPRAAVSETAEDKSTNSTGIEVSMLTLRRVP